MNDANTVVFSKAVTQYFNPGEYSNQGYMNYTSQALQYFKYNMNDPLKSITYAVT